jgi:hypothetical protein
MTRLALRWITAHLLTNSAAIRSSACGTQLGQSRPLRHVNRESAIYAPNGGIPSNRL